MKAKIEILGILLILVMSSFMFGLQESDFIQWTGKAKDVNGLLIINQKINVQVILRFGTEDNAKILYIETHTPTTDSKGVFNLQIGGGNYFLGDFNNLPWGSKKSIAEITVNGNSIGKFEIHKKRNYNRYKNPNVNKNVVNPGYKGAQLKTNITPLFSIKLGNDVINAGEGIFFSGQNHNYTINTKDKVTLTAGDGLEVTGTYPNYIIRLRNHYIGEHYLGGIIFWLDETKRHGLIAVDEIDENGLSSGGTWSTFPWDPQYGQIMYIVRYNDPGLNKVNAYMSGIGGGKYNTFAMLNHDPLNNEIHDIAEPYSFAEFYFDKNTNFFIKQKNSQLYLPSIDELRLIYKQKSILKDILNLNSNHYIFWSSTEGSDIWIAHGDGPNGADLKIQNHTRIPHNGIKYKGVCDFVKLQPKYFHKNKKDANLFETATGTNKSKPIYSGRPGALAINFFTGKTLNIAKYYSHSFILIRDF